MGFFSDLTFVEVRIVFLESGHFSVFNVPTYISDTVCRIPSVSGMGVEIQLEIVDRAAYSDGVGYIVGVVISGGLYYAHVTGRCGPDEQTN